MGEKSDSNTILYADTGNGWQPMGKIEEMPEFIPDGDAKESDFTNLQNGEVTVTFTLSWWSRVKLWWVLKRKIFLKQLFCWHKWADGYIYDAKDQSRKPFCRFCMKCGKTKMVSEEQRTGENGYGEKVKRNHIGKHR